MHKTLLSLSISISVWLLSSAALAAVQREVFSFHFEGGSRYLKVEALRDDLLHFELLEPRGAGHDHQGPQLDAAWVSPMVDDWSYNQFLGASFFQRHGDGVETSEIRARVSNDLRRMELHDKIRGIHLTTLRSEKLDEDIKTIHIEKLGMRNVYGVGNLFFGDNQSADGDWVGRVWNQRGHGNFRFGLDFGDDFERGGPSISQFPMIFVLGGNATNGFSNYGLFFDQPYKISWNFTDVSFEGSTGWAASMWGDQVRWFFFTGPDLKDIRRDYMRLVGHSPIPPKAIFGHWTSKFGYNNWSEIKKDVESLAANDFPLDGVALDIQWFGGTFGEPSSHRMGSLQFDESKFPNPAAQIKDFQHRFGIQFIPIEESYVDARLDDFKAMANHEFRRHSFGFNFFGFEPYRSCYLARHSHHYDGQNHTWYPVYVTTDYRRAGSEGTQNWWGGGGMIDWSNPDARRYWHQLKRHPLSKMGITAHWLDLGEPEMYYEHSIYYGLPGIGKWDHGSVHNLYNLFWAKGISEGYASGENQDELRRVLSEYYGQPLAAAPRHFTMSRAGTVGSHRYSALWSGDVFSNMGNLRAHLGTQKDMSLLGVDYYSSDTGGFFHDNRPEGDPHDREIVTQWAAVSSLLDNPMRPHGWALNGERMTLDARGDLDSNRANIRRRYELIPYVYSLAHMAYRFGDPIYPPVVYHFQADLNARILGNMKMIGPSLLFGVVASHGEHERRVYLPRGRWIDYENNEWFSSEGGYSKPIPLFRQERVPPAELAEHPHRRFFLVPLFARAGSIIPRMHVDEKTMNVLGRRKDGVRREEMIVRVYTDETPSEFTLYEDDGISVAYQVGQVRETKISQRLEGNRAKVIIFPSKGSYAGAPESRESVVELVTDGKRATKVELNGAVCSTLDQFPSGASECWFSHGPRLIRAGSKKLAVTSRKVFVVELEQ